MRCIILLSRGFFCWDGGAGKRRGGEQWILLLFCMLDLCLIDRCDKVCSVVSSTDGSVDTVDTGTADPSPEGPEMQLCCVQLGSP